MPNPTPLATARLDDQIGFRLRLAQLAVFSDIIDALKPLDLRPIDLSALLLIEANPEVRQKALGDKLKIARSNIVNLIDSLETRNLVSRVVDSGDRRANQLTLTEAGVAVLAHAKQIQAEHRRRLLDCLDGLDVNQFMKGLTRLTDLGRPT